MLYEKSGKEERKKLMINSFCVVRERDFQLFLD